MSELRPGSVRWAWLDPRVGREQAGRRPVVVVASQDYIDIVTTLVIVVPISSRLRGWANHVPITGVQGLGTSVAMTEQVRTISRDRLEGSIGSVDDACLARIQTWLGDFLGLT